MSQHQLVMMTRVLIFPDSSCGLHSTLCAIVIEVLNKKALHDFCFKSKDSICLLIDTNINNIFLGRVSGIDFKKLSITSNRNTRSTTPGIPLITMCV